MAKKYLPRKIRSKKETFCERLAVQAYARAALRPGPGAVDILRV
ncbi:MAG TPA: hypothetical protein VF747_04505 [Blastocatellia bacterium]